jgi:hypothetical protein
MEVEKLIKQVVSDFIESISGTNWTKKELKELANDVKSGKYKITIKRRVGKKGIIAPDFTPEGGLMRCKR